MTAPLLDRLLQRCRVLNIKDRSYGLKELETLMRCVGCVIQATPRSGKGA